MAAVKLHLTIQAHPSRTEMAVSLADDIGASITWDPDPDGFPSAWRTYRHALESRPTGITNLGIIQDDATPCRGFTKAVSRAVRARPDRLIALFVSGQARDHAAELWAAGKRGDDWALLRSDRWFPAVATVWPVTLIEPFLAFVDEQNWPVQFRADDEIIGRFLRHARIDALATVPSLVQHDDMVPSLLGKRARYGDDPGRMVSCGVPDDCDPALIDWKQGPT